MPSNFLFYLKFPEKHVHAVTSREPVVLILPTDSLSEWNTVEVKKPHIFLFAVAVKCVTFFCRNINDKWQSLWAHIVKEIYHENVSRLCVFLSFLPKLMQKHLRKLKKEIRSKIYARFKLCSNFRRLNCAPIQRETRMRMTFFWSFRVSENEWIFKQIFD